MAHVEGSERRSLLMQVARTAFLAALAFVVAALMGSPELGLRLAGTIVVLELLWQAGALALRHWRRTHSPT